LCLGEEWALSLLYPKTQLDEGYISVFADYLDGAVAFSVIEKRFRYSPDRRATRSSGPTESFSVAEWIEFVHGNLNDIQSSLGQGPLAVWLLHFVMKPDGHDPMNAKNHFELLSCVRESDTEEDMSPLIFLDPRVDCASSGGPSRSASGIGPADGGGRGPSEDLNMGSLSQLPPAAAPVVKEGGNIGNAALTSCQGGGSDRSLPSDGAAGATSTAGGSRRRWPVPSAATASTLPPPASPQAASGYMSFPSHRVLVLDEVHWDAFEQQFKLVEFRPGSRGNIIPGMFLLLSRRIALRRIGKTCLLLAEVVDVRILSVHEACAQFPLEAGACNLRGLSASWRSSLVTCLVVQNVRLAPEFVFLAKGNQGFLHQFSRKKGIPQFCAREDVGKRVSVLLDSGGNCRNVQYMLLEPTTDNAVCSSGGTRPEHVKNSDEESPTSRSATVHNNFRYVAHWFNARKAARTARDPKRFETKNFQQQLDESTDSDEGEDDISVSPPENASPLDLLKHNSDLLYTLTTKAHRHFDRIKSVDKSRKMKFTDGWKALLMNVCEKTPNMRDWEQMSENSNLFKKIHKNIEKYSENLACLVRSTFVADYLEEGIPPARGDTQQASFKKRRATAGSAAPPPAAAGRATNYDSDEDEDKPLALRAAAAARQLAGAGAATAARPEPVVIDVEEPCDARTGDYVEIFWERPVKYRGWWKARVQRIDVKGIAFVIYDATPEKDGWDATAEYAHKLAALKHFNIIGEKHDAWKHVGNRRTAANTRSKEVSCPHLWQLRYQSIVMPSVL